MGNPALSNPTPRQFFSTKESIMSIWKHPLVPFIAAGLFVLAVASWASLS